MRVRNKIALALGLIVIIQVAGMFGFAVAYRTDHSTKTDGGVVVSKNVVTVYRTPPNNQSSTVNAGSLRSGSRAKVKSTNGSGGVAARAPRRPPTTSQPVVHIATPVAPPQAVAVAASVSNLTPNACVVRPTEVMGSAVFVIIGTGTFNSGIEGSIDVHLNIYGTSGPTLTADTRYDNPAGGDSWQVAGTTPPGFTPVNCTVAASS